MLFFIIIFLYLLSISHQISIHPMLFFIASRHGINCTWYKISIHPMLFFIKSRKCWMTGQSHFNTSNVIFYRRLTGMWCVYRTFQYIQCYFLSSSSYLSFIWYWYFNTSNVIFYLGQVQVPLRCIIISIHPMLFFILHDRTSGKYSICISIHPMLFFIVSMPLMWNTLSNFNTSNVIFYLGQVQVPLRCIIISIHPMLFFIHGGNSPIESRWNFNTSNVIFYRCSGPHFYVICIISIHPMLFFIKAPGKLY